MKAIEKVKVPTAKRIILAAVSAIMFAIPFYYYENLKQTPNIGFNNTETNLFVYVVVSFFALFFALGLLFAALALIRRERKMQHISKNIYIISLEITASVFAAFILGFFIKYYNVVVFFLLAPTAIAFIVLMINNFKRTTHSKSITITAVLCLLFFSFSIFFSYLLITSNIQYSKQDKFLTEFLDGKNVIYNQYGGWENYPEGLGTFEATGYFHLSKQNGRHWFVDPSGKPFISKGVNHINIDSNKAYNEYALNKHGSREDWGIQAIDVLRRNGFNTVTSWSSPEVLDRGMPFTLLMDFGSIYGSMNNWGYYGDYFEEAFLILCDEVAQQRITPYSDSEWLLGIFTDNELSWGADWRNIYNHIQIYIKFSNPSAGKQVLIDFLRTELDNSVQELNSTFGINISSFDDLYNFSPDNLKFKTERALQLEDKFGGMVAEQYAIITNDALKRYAPNHLNLGCRYALYPGKTIVTKIAEHSDVISYAGYFDNFHYTFGGKEVMDYLYNELNKPFLIEEYGVRALDTNMPNFLYSGSVVINQKQRAALASSYIESFMYQPYAVGYHWFQYTDNNIYGLLNGENYGLIDKNEKEYTTFTSLMLKTNNALEYIHISDEREIKYKVPILWG